MSARSIRNRLTESPNIWPGFVDILATLLIVIIFVLMVFTVSQIYLSDAISGRDKALENLRNQIDELSKILVIESREKQQFIKELEESQKDLGIEKQITSELESDVDEKNIRISAQSENILALSGQIQDLLKELRIVAKALEIYEGEKIISLNTRGLGERINKALAGKIDQLNKLNNDLELANENLDLSKIQLSKKIDQLNLSKNETAEQLEIVKDLNSKLSKNEIELQNQIKEYQKLTNDLIAINESLGLEDANLFEQLQAIKNKNNELAQLNENLIKKDNTIFDLRAKITELNNILSLSDENQNTQEAEIADLKVRLQLLEEEKTQITESSTSLINESEEQIETALNQVDILSSEIDLLKNEITILNSALEASEQNLLTKELKIEVLGERLNKALTSKVFELQKYRSEFFGRLQDILGNREDIKIVGDRFIFESELLFDSGSATLQLQGKEKLKQIGQTLKETTMGIPDDIDWIIQVEGHTDKNPINTIQFPSNWELSSARANTVLKLLLDLGFDPQRLSAAGYGEFYPIAFGEKETDYRQNRRIELKLTSR